MAKYPNQIAITIDRKTWKELTYLKIDNGLKTLDAVIQALLRNKKG